MGTEQELMLAGEMYHPADPELVKDRMNARRLVRLYNHTTEAEMTKRTELPQVPL